MPLRLVLANKAYSSWSLRPWILLATFHIPFEEVVCNIYDEAGRKKLRKFSPTGKAPVLFDGDIRVWESLAIMEYVAEKYPDRAIWPRRKAAGGPPRAHRAGAPARGDPRGLGPPDRPPGPLEAFGQVLVEPGHAQRDPHAFRSRSCSARSISSSTSTPW